VAIAALGALLAAIAAELLARWRIDDAIGAVPVHLVAGIWGTLAVALFAPVEAFGGLDRFGQLGVQALGVFAIGGFAFAAGLVGLYAYSRFSKLRVSPRDEVIGLNIAEHGASTSLLDLLSQMDVQANSGDFSRPVNVETESEASQVAAFYNAVLDKFNLEMDRRRIAMQRLADLAHHDALTGLGNRRLLLDGLREALSAADDAQRGALLFLDLDGFKQINDRIGHDAGDALLKVVAHRLRVVAGPEVLIGRLGGDEFAIVLRELDDPVAAATRLADALISALSAPVEFGPHRLRVGVSVGIAVFGGDQLETVKTLTKRADTAMYEAKLAGKGTWRVFDAPAAEA
jgi:Amt family ammonium transporter